MDDLIVERLPPQDIRLVFPLVREAEPAVRLAEWLRYAGKRLGAQATPANGIMVVRRAGQRFPCGLFCYHRERDLAHGSVLTAEYVIAVDVLDPAPVLAALIRAMEVLAKELGCPVVRVVVHNRLTEVTSGLLAAGHVQEGTTLYKRLPGTSLG